MKKYYHPNRLFLKYLRVLVFFGTWVGTAFEQVGEKEVMEIVIFFVSLWVILLICLAVFRMIKNPR